MAWLRNQPVHEEVDLIIRQLFPYGVAELILDMANNPPVLTMHYGVFCQLGDPCEYCRDALRAKRAKRGR